ncbi:25-hydroxycholesterol 7-alpha-hydroxylase 1 [Seiridium cupressi]
MALSFSLVVGAGAAIYAFLFALLRLTQDVKEPVSIGEGNPFVSPLLNMATKGVGFHRFMRDKYNLPIYTLRMPGSRIYVINAPQLLTSVQNQVGKLSFTAIEASIAANVIGVSKTTNDVIGHDVTADGSYLTSFPKYVHSALSAGPGLDAMNRRSIQYITQSLDTWQKRGDTTVQLFEWVRHELLMESTEGVYGPKNPFRDPAMERPGIWERYFEAHAYKQGSELIQARVKINDHFGIPLKETARIEIGGSQAILSNTLPATFWVIYRIFSDPKVLEDIRLELSAGVIEDQSGSFIIDLSHVKSSCPIFLSTLKETMRIHSTSSATRIAMEDHLLDNKYLLKKGSTIMMPSHVQHTNPSVWGETVDVFNHKEFLREPGVRRINPVAFRGFGGGTTLCPGRHFASTEILMFTALLVLRFELRPLSGQ